MIAAKKIKTREIRRSDYTIFVVKAKEFYQTMFQAEKKSNWNAVGLNGVHTIISLLDALLVKYTGIRSIDDEHIKVVDLVNSSLSNIIKDVKTKGNTARRILAKKNLVAYENRNFLKKEALDMIKQVERFFNWAIEYLQ